MLAVDKTIVYFATVKWGLMGGLQTRAADSKAFGDSLSCLRVMAEAFAAELC